MKVCDNSNVHYRARARVARSRGMRTNLLVKEHKTYLGFLVIS